MRKFELSLVKNLGFGRRIGLDPRNGLENGSKPGLAAAWFLGVK